MKKAEADKKAREMTETTTHYMCLWCGDLFDSEGVWHCPECDYHVPIPMDECKYCHEGKMPDETMVPVEMTKEHFFVYMRSHGQSAHQGFMMDPKNLKAMLDGPRGIRSLQMKYGCQTPMPVLFPELWQKMVDFLNKEEREVSEKLRKDSH